MAATDEIPIVVPSLKEYRALVADAKCQWDGKPLANVVETYDHDGGWQVQGMARRQWLSVRCTHCGYDWSLNKLGVPKQ